LLFDKLARPISLLGASKCEAKAPFMNNFVTLITINSKQQQQQCWPSLKLYDDDDGGGEI